MKHLRSVNKLSRQRGAVAIWFALLLPVLLGFAALAVDLARIHLVKVELQKAADAAALGGARSLSEKPLPTGQPYNWPAAAAKALDVALHNYANGDSIKVATIDTGYWNIPSRSWKGAVAPSTGDVPAVRATIAISEGQNNGPLHLFFAPFLGFDESNVQATSIAVIAPPGGGTGMFPMAINKTMFDLFWDSTNNIPKLDSTGKLYEIKLSSVYSGNITSGQWTSFQTDKDDVPTVRDLIRDGNTTSVSIGDLIWIEPGVKSTIYNTKEGNKNTPLSELIGKDVAVPVVNVVETHAQEQVVAIAGYHIQSVYQNGSHSYITGYFVDLSTIPGLNPGNGNGTYYGAYTPPKLVQ